MKDTIKNPNSHKSARQEKRAAKNSLIDDTSPDDDKQRLAGKSALLPRVPRTSSAVKKQKTASDDLMDMEDAPISPIPSDFSSNEFSSANSSPAAAVLTVANNSIPTVTQSGNLTVTSPIIENQSQLLEVTVKL